MSPKSFPNFAYKYLSSSSVLGVGDSLQKLEKEPALQEKYSKATSYT